MPYTGCFLSQSMRVAEDRASFLDQLSSAKTEALKSFGDQVMLVEKFVNTPRSVSRSWLLRDTGHLVTIIGDWW